MICARCEGVGGWLDTSEKPVWVKCTHSQCENGRIIDESSREKKLERDLRSANARIAELEAEILRLKMNGPRFRDPIPVEPHPLIPWPPHFAEPEKWRFPLPVTCKLPN